MGALYEVYRTVLEREFPGFRTIKLKVPKFEPLDERNLTTEQKRGLCRFLEEALCNVGKHAVGSTRLDVVCAQIEGYNVIQVLDNGLNAEGLLDEARSLREAAPKSQMEAKRHINPQTHGMGTRQAQRLARQLGGRFERSPREPQGICCEVVWKARP